MRIVVDTNRMIAALIKDGLSRRILFSERISFFVPAFSLSEIYKYEKAIREKAHITHEEFACLLSLLFEHITILPESFYRSFLKMCIDLISDVDDVSFLAAALAINAEGIWTEDQHFQEQESIRVFTTDEMKKLI